MPSHWKHTKIVATLGPATNPPGILDAMVSAGLDCARLNCSHADRADLLRMNEEVRVAEERAGRPLAVLLDLQGPKLRLVADTPDRVLRAGEQVFITGPDAPDRDGQLRVAFEDFALLATDESLVILGDGVPRLRVLNRDEDTLHCEVLDGGPVGSRKGITVTHADTRLPALTEKDFADILVAAEIDADFVALSFVRSADDIEMLRGALLQAGSKARIIAKIEKIEAFGHLDEILDVSDGVMVARGDYGVEAGFAAVPAMQKAVLHAASQRGILAITATQMLESMTVAAQPTRAEATDVYNAVVDGTSALMLSGETGVGSFPVQAVRVMADIAHQAEQDESIYCAPHQELPNPDEAVMHAAVALGRDTGAAAIVVPTSTGGTARACAHYRPKRPVFALCHDEHVGRQLALEWGVHPQRGGVVRTLDELIEASLQLAAQLGVVSGEPVVVTAGPAVGTAGTTNLITLQYLP